MPPNMASRISVYYKKVDIISEIRGCLFRNFEKIVDVGYVINIYVFCFAQWLESKFKLFFLAHYREICLSVYCFSENYGVFLSFIKDRLRKSYLRVELLAAQHARVFLIEFFTVDLNMNDSALDSVYKYFITVFNNKNAR